MTPTVNDRFDADNHSNDPENVDSSEIEMPMPVLVTRSAYGGALMGLANLVPGISGGTMLLAAGIYPSFIEAVSDVTRFRFKFRSLAILACVVAAAGIAILLFAGILKDLVVDHRWVMYSLFIGLTLGGVPLVWKLARPASTGLVISGFLAFAAMVGLALLQANSVNDSNSSFPMLFAAGLAGASAMILPGLSGGYLLLLMGQYVPILSAIDKFKDALKEGDFSAAMDPALTVMLPVGIGVVIGVAVVGNLLQWLLKRYRKATLGALLGLLIGSTVGLWPFQHGVQPKVGDVIKGATLTEESIEEVDLEDWPTEYFQPASAGQIGGALGLIAIGFAITLGVAALGSGKEERET